MMVRKKTIPPPLSSIGRRLKSVRFLALAVLILAGSVLPVRASTATKTVNASATVAYTVQGLQHNLNIQKFYIASTYLYVTQRSGGTVYLSRCLMSGSTATYVDEMTLTNCGHGQTLDMYTYNGINYLYVSSKADSSTTYYWSLQVARVLYAAGATYDYTDLHRFTYMNYADATGARLGTTYRVDAGGNSTYTVFRIQTQEGTVTYSIYDTVALNKLLDSNEQVDMSGSAAVNACVKSFTQSGSDIVRPNGSFQGIDMLGSTDIYVTGGGEGQTPGIARMSNTGAYRTLVNITNMGAHEIEGVQTKNDNVYFNIVPDTTNKKNTQKICYVPESIF